MKHPLPNLSVPHGPPVGSGRGSRPRPVSDRPALPGGRLSSLLGRWLELLIGSTAVPSASTVLEIASWRADFPELALVERELRGIGEGPCASAPAATPFGEIGMSEFARLVGGTGRRRSHG